MHFPILPALAFMTLLLLIAVGLWSVMSTKRSQATGGHTSGLGGPNDPMAGGGPTHPDFGS